MNDCKFCEMLSDQRNCGCGLCFWQPLESEEFRKQLKDAGLHIGASVIMDFLDEQVRLTSHRTTQSSLVTPLS